MRILRSAAVATAAGFLMTLAAGCGGGPTYVPVSGTVTYNGQPYANAFVSFQPVGGKGHENPGRGSMGLTDEHGKFTLAVDPDTPGALAGPHAIRIYTRSGRGEVGPPPETGTPDGGAGAKPSEVEYDPIPLDWNERSTRTFDVPPGGTDKADFEIKGPPLKNRKK
jgi:hypothetical protein